MKCIITEGKNKGKTVTIESESRGWTSVTDEEGTVIKVRPAHLEAVENSTTKEPSSTESDSATENQGEDEQAEVKMSDAFKNRRAKYKQTDGCGDELQLQLQNYSPTEVAQIAALSLGLGQMELVDRYSHLNMGQVRMNSGNRLRAAMKKGAVTEQDLREVMDTIKFGH